MYTLDQVLYLCGLSIGLSFVCAGVLFFQLKRSLGLKQDRIEELERDNECFKKHIDAGDTPMARVMRE